MKLKIAAKGKARKRLGKRGRTKLALAFRYLTPVPGERVVVAGSEDFDNADRVRINE